MSSTKGPERTSRRVQVTSKTRGRSRNCSSKEARIGVPRPELATIAHTTSHETVFDEIVSSLLGSEDTRWRLLLFDCTGNHGLRKRVIEKLTVDGKGHLEAGRMSAAQTVLLFSSSASLDRGHCSYASTMGDVR